MLTQFPSVLTVLKLKSISWTFPLLFMPRGDCKLPPPRKLKILRRFICLLNHSEIKDLLRLNTRMEQGEIWYALTGSTTGQWALPFYQEKVVLSLKQMHVLPQLQKLKYNYNIQPQVRFPSLYDMKNVSNQDFPINKIAFFNSDFNARYQSRSRFYYSEFSFVS